MLFDVQAALADILSTPLCDTRDTRDTTAPVSQKSRVSQPGHPENLEAEPDAPHGRSVTGSPLTWTGRVVSLDEWRNLSDWDRHGPNGRVWSGITRQWEAPT